MSKRLRQLIREEKLTEAKIGQLQKMLADVKNKRKQEEDRLVLLAVHRSRVDLDSLRGILAEAGPQEKEEEGPAGTESGDVHA